MPRATPKERVGSSLGSLGHIALAGAAVASILFAGAWVSLSSCREKHTQLADRLQDSEKDIDPSVLARQSVILRNLSTRIKTAEAALNRLRKLEAFNQQQQSDAAAKRRVAASAQKFLPPAAGVPQRAPAPPAASSASEGSDAELEGDEASDKEETKEEVDEEAEEKQQKLDQEEQLKVIKYNETSKTFLRFRPVDDAKCGSRVPVLPDDTVVECNPTAASPCCSNLGWCGSTKEHCRCALCVDFRKPRESQ